MLKLTTRMEDVLKKADIERGEINDVPLQTVFGLEERQLVPSDWQRGPITTTTQGGNFPKHSRVKLSPAGLQIARELQGLKPGNEDIPD